MYPMKSSGTAYLIWFFFGLFGGHRFYLNYVGTGIIYLLTFGLFGIGWFIDLFLIPGMVERENMKAYMFYNRNNAGGQVTIINAPMNNVGAGGGYPPQQVNYGPQAGYPQQAPSLPPVNHPPR